MRRPVPLVCFSISEALLFVFLFFQSPRGAGSSNTVSNADKAEAVKPIEKHFCDAVINFLLRIACQVNRPDRDLFFLSILHVK